MTERLPVPSSAPATLKDNCSTCQEYTPQRTERRNRPERTIQICMRCEGVAFDDAGRSR